jgi:hypothetical protein
MTLTASVGQAQALNGHEAGLQATHLALKNIGMGTPSLAIVIASRYYEAKEIANSVSSLLGDTPIIGFSSASVLTQEGQTKNAVGVALISANNLKISEHWLSGYAQSGRETASHLIELAAAKEKDSQKNILFFADGFNGDAEQMCLGLTGSPISLIGGLSSGNPHTGTTSQIAGTQAGSGSLAAALIEGDLKIGIGSDHGWRPIGSQFRVTRSRGFWIRTLDGRPASEAYSNLFGYPASEWGFPPLNYLVRLYPLGIDQGEELLVRSPLRVEADGSFRMNAPVRDGVDAYLLTGSPATCIDAAQRAAQKANLALKGAKPVFALVLADISWQMIFKARPGAEIEAIKAVLGDDVPIIGGYTLGQVAPGKDGSPPDFLNQHITVIVFGEDKEEDTATTSVSMRRSDIEKELRKRREQLDLE